MKIPARLRRRIEHAVADRVAGQLVPVQQEVSRLHDRIQGLTDRIEGLAAAQDLKNVSERLDRTQEQLHHGSERWEGWLRRLEEQTSWDSHQISRLAPQAASFEKRLEGAARPIVVTAEAEAVPEARLLVEVVREEHARVRARLSLLSSYEERLRRLEERAFRVPPAPDDESPAEASLASSDSP